MKINEDHRKSIQIANETKTNEQQRTSMKIEENQCTNMKRNCRFKKNNGCQRDSLGSNWNQVEANDNHWNLMKINSIKDKQWKSVRIHAHHYNVRTSNENNDTQPKPLKINERNQMNTYDINES